MKVRFFNIVWDTSDTSDEMKDVAPPPLPAEVVMEVDDDTDLEYEGADVLSDKYGFCVESFDYERGHNQEEVQNG